MSKIRNILLAGALATAGSTPALAATFQVNLDGSAGHATIQSAIDAAALDADTSIVIEIIEAGTYEGTVNLAPLHSKTVVISNTSGGAVISTNVLGEGLWVARLSDPLFYDGPMDVTINGIHIRRNDGTGAAFDIDGDATHTVDFTLNDCIVEHTETGAGGEGLKLDDGFLGSPGTTLTATNTRFESMAQISSGKSALRVQDATWENLDVTLTDCIVRAPYRAVRSDGANNQNFLLTRTEVTTTGDERNFYMDDPHSDCTFTFIDCTLFGLQETVYSSGDAGENNAWLFQRCTISNVGAPTADNLVRLRYVSALPSPLETTNTVELYNCILLPREGTDPSNDRALSVENVVARVYHNTFVGAGTGTAVAIGGSSFVCEAMNNAFLNFLDANLMSGSYSNPELGISSNNNVIVGPLDDSSRGGNGLFIEVLGAGEAACLAAAGLDSGYEPQVGSALIGAGATDAFISTAIGGVDFDNLLRPSPPAAGAKDVGTSSSVSDWSVLGW